MCDIAIKPIKKGDMITTNATVEVQKELKTFIEALEGMEIQDFKQLKGGYRNAVISYLLPNQKLKTLTLKRMDGNWRITKSFLTT
jgi:hypothetical protein